MLQEIKNLIFSPDSSNIKLGFVLAKYQLSEIEFMKLINSIARDSASENFSCHFYTYMKYEDWENLYEQVPEVHLLGPKVYNKVIPQEIIDLFFKYYNQGPDYILIAKRIEYAIMDNLQYYGDDVKLYRSNFLKKRFIYHDFNDVYLILAKPVVFLKLRWLLRGRISGHPGAKRQLKKRMYGNPSCIDRCNSGGCHYYHALHRRSFQVMQKSSFPCSRLTGKKDIPPRELDKVPG